MTDDTEADGVPGNGADVTPMDGSVIPSDTDNDGAPDYSDIDSDNDGKADKDEAGKDNDHDGIPDVVDHDDSGDVAGGGDSDNDGISDEEECATYPNCPDLDNDGKPDYIDNNNDFDDDGLTDTEEDSNLDKDNDPATNPRDTDGDGIPDYKDTDSDNDGLSDTQESTPKGKDTDKDGIPDVIDADDASGASGDSDNDGIPDSIECSLSPCRDTDGDGKPDYADDDSDNDGIKDGVEVGSDPENPKDSDGDGIPDVADPVTGEEGEKGGDSDGDGFADVDECDSWPTCSDTDGDGIADYIDKDSFPIDGSKEDTDSDAEKELGTVKTGVRGAGSLSWMFFAALALLISVRQNAARLMILPLLLSSVAANATWWEEMDLYVGAGVGQSELDPQVSNTAYSVDDHSQKAWKLTGGWDWNDYISVEAYYSNLGRVDLSQGAEIEYRMFGGDAILHYWARGGERSNGSVAIYAKAGLNHMSNKGYNVNYESDYKYQLFGGVGAEWYLPNDFSARLEIESYDIDASLISLNLVKRFGLKPSKKALPPLVDTPAIQEEFIVMVEALPATAAGPVIVDSDLDGVTDELDQCANTPVGVSVNDVGCAMYMGEIGDVISNVQFEFNSAELLVSSEKNLNVVADLLTTYKLVKLEIHAHTDSMGAATYNKRLSQNRADAVVKFLQQKSIAKDRMIPKGFGEDKPVADNKTEEGRAKNRRVDFVVIER
ncbi:MAG: outer membrane protein OmpA-like peptidoglycan-associated protein [Bermanella sp.]